MFIDLNDATDHAAIILKVAVPICVTDDEIGSAVGAVLIGNVEKSAEIRPNL
jgi:hypothetical protein